MNKFILIILLFLYTSVCPSQTMCLYLNNGKVDRYFIEEVDSITFSQEKRTNQSMAIIHSYGGVKVPYNIALPLNNGIDSIRFQESVLGNSDEFDLSMLNSRNVSINVPYNSVSYQGDCVFPLSDIVVHRGMYRSPYIVSNVSSDYKIAKFHAQGGRYLIVSPGSESCMTLCKFKDKGCSVLDYAVIGGMKAFAKIMYLEEGYYCFGWCGKENAVVEGEAYITNIIPSIPWLIREDEFINTTNIPIERQVESKYRTYSNDFDLSAVIKPMDFDENGEFECSVGKVQMSYTASTLVSIGKDDKGSFIALSTIPEGSLQVEHRYKKYLDGLTLQKGCNYKVKLEQRDGTYRYHNISLVTDKSTEYRYEQLEKNWRECVGGGWGNITILPMKGLCSVSNVRFDYPVDIASLKLVVIGHSFVEGLNSTVSNLDQRFASLLASRIGEKYCAIKGQGGAKVTSICPTLQSDLFMLRNAQYLIYCIGTNDPDNESVAKTLIYIDILTKIYGIKPIWLTIPPTKDGDTHDILNNTIRKFDDYVDVTTIFYREDGSVNTALFADNVHPTIEGYRKIYEMIAEKYHCIFE